jgi:hypothetical protein
MISLWYCVTGIFVKRRIDTVFTYFNIQKHICIFLDCSRYLFVIVSYNTDVYKVYYYYYYYYYYLIYVFVLFVSTTCAYFKIGLWSINSVHK